MNSKRILFFTAPGCASCGPALEQLERGLVEAKSHVVLDVYSLDQPHAMQLRGRYGFTSVPAVIGITGGGANPDWMLTGNAPGRDATFWKEHILHWIEEPNAG